MVRAGDDDVPADHYTKLREVALQVKPASGNV